MSTKSRRVQEGRGIGMGISIAINKPRGENTTFTDDVQMASCGACSPKLLAAKLRELSERGASPMEILLIGGIIGVVVYVIALHSKISQWKRRSDFIKDVKSYKREEERKIRKALDDLQLLHDNVASSKAQLHHEQEVFKSVFAANGRTYPWVAKVHGDLLEAEADSLSRTLTIKKRPALKAAEEVQAFKEAVRERLQAAKYAQYKALIYEDVFPFLKDFVEGAPAEELVAADEQIGADDDPVKRYLTPSEYSSLSSAMRSQSALERYVARRKSSWEIGRDYERYIGFEYESRGWDVHFHGAIKGFEDLGRDLIATSSAGTEIIQCKYWSQWKSIHESTIFQLFGTVADYLFEHELVGPTDDVFQSMKKHQVRAVFVTSTTLSERAIRAGSALGINMKTSVPFNPAYPRIKCNVGRDGEKRYHLPFDQQYDRIKIEAGKGEFYASTASEAEAKGFRRAFRWQAAPAG